MLLFDNIAVNMNRNNHCRTWWLIVAYTKLVFLMLLQQPVFENVRLLYTVNFHVRGWEMSKTKREWINPAAAPLQGSYGVVAVSQKYQNLKNRIRNELKRKSFVSGIVRCDDCMKKILQCLTSYKQFMSCSLS